MEEGDCLMFGILCLLFAVFCDFKNMYIGKGMSPADKYYGRFVSDNDKIWHDHLNKCMKGQESWTSWDDPRIKWEDNLK